MRKIIGVVVSCLVACSLFLTVQPAFAVSYSGGWVPSQEVEGVTPTLTIQYSQDLTYAFGIYDIDRNDGDGNIFTTTDECMILASGGTGYTSNSLTFSDLDTTVTGYDWWVTDSVTGGTVHLGDSIEFGFFFSDYNGGVPTEFSYDVTEIMGLPATYGLTWPEGGTGPETHYVTVMNAKPVPIPTAMLLLSSGLVGLAGFKRKMDS